MKFFQQNGFSLERTQLAESDHVCVCCQHFDHGAQDYHPDDVECPTCGALCSCDCHRVKQAHVQPPL